MKRPLVVLCLLGLVVTACGVADPMGPDSTPVAVHIPSAADMNWNGFRVHLDPTVLVWADETQVDLRSVVRSALERIEQRLHGPPTSISIQAGSYWTIPDIGIGGDADRRTGEVKVSMDARRVVHVERLLRVWVPVALAHELHHSMRIVKGPGYGSTLLDAMITEGSAEAFVRETYPAAPAIPWVSPLPAPAERAVWRRAQSVLSAPDDIELHQQWFVGGESLPQWPGYRIGYEIAERYLARHPRATAAQLATLTAKQIFKDSGFAQAMSAPAIARRAGRT